MDPQSNGHFPPPGQPMPPQPSEQSVLRALKARLDIARQTVQAREDECDFIHALHLTSTAERDALAEENSQLKARIVELENPTSEPQGAAGN